MKYKPITYTGARAMFTGCAECMHHKEATSRTIKCLIFALVSGLLTAINFYTRTMKMLIGNINKSSNI